MDAGLFDRGEVEPTRTLLPAWPLLLWLAIGLLLLDIAGRRLAWDGRRIAALLERAVRRAEPAEAKAAATAETLAVLRETGDGAAAVTVPATSDGEPSQPAKSSVTQPEEEQEEPDASPPAEVEKRPDGKRVAAALDMLLGRKDAAPPPPPEPPDDDADETDIGATTQGLLDARRARRERDDG